MREWGWKLEVRWQRGEAEADAVKEKSGAQKIETIKGWRWDDCIFYFFFTVRKPIKRPRKKKLSVLSLLSDCQQRGDWFLLKTLKMAHMYSLIPIKSDFMRLEPKKKHVKMVIMVKVLRAFLWDSDSSFPPFPKFSLLLETTTSDMLFKMTSFDRNYGENGYKDLQRTHLQHWLLMLSATQDKPAINNWFTKTKKDVRIQGLHPDIQLVSLILGIAD